MGTVTARVMGNVKGKVGTVVFTRWKKLYIAKGLYNKRKKKDVSQLSQVAQLAMMSSFIKAFSDEIKLGFRKNTNKHTERSIAMKYNLANAIEGTFPHQSINYRKIKMSDGSLEGAWATKLFFEPDQVRVTWQMSELSNQKTIGKDKAQILVYNLTKKITLSRKTNLERNALEYTINDLKGHTGDTIHVWIFFVSANGKMVSNSDYIGSGTVIGQPT